MSRLIDADALLEHVWRDRLDSRERIAELVKFMPTIEERKKGKWVGADSQCGIGCPFCGTPVDDFCGSIDYIDLNYEPNFCPNCGADMKGEANV